MNQSKLSVYRFFVPVLALFFSFVFLAFIGINVSAAENAVPSLDKYKYTLDSNRNTIDIDGYTGNGEDLVIPASFVIDGVTYKTEINGTCKIVGVKKLSFDRGVTINGRGIFSRSDFEEIDFTGVTSKLQHSVAHLLSYNDSLTKITWGDFEINGSTIQPVKSMEYMFYNCPKLKELDLSSFDVSNMYFLADMVYYCTELEYINMSGLDFSNMSTEYIGYMDFGMNSCTNLKYIK